MRTVLKLSKLEILNHGIIFHDIFLILSSEINCVVVVVRTGGDNPSIISHTFKVAAEYNAQIVVTALKINKNGARASRVQIAYEYIKQKLSFEEMVSDIHGKKFRNAQYVQERETASFLVKIVEDCVSSLAKHV